MCMLVRDPEAKQSIAFISCLHMPREFLRLLQKKLIFIGMYKEVLQNANKLCFMPCCR